MKIRTLSIACATAVALVSAGCTAVYKNSDACEQMMRDKSAGESSVQHLEIQHTGAGIHGSRVVVEGQFQPVPASDAAAASAVAAGTSAAQASATAASGAVAASAPAAASKSATRKNKVLKNIAAECSFHGLDLTAFRWLSPDELAHPAGATDQ